MSRDHEVRVGESEHSPEERSSENTQAIQFNGPPILSEDADDELIEEYVAESLDHLRASEAILLGIEDHPDDTEAINTVFRAFHTVKGSSGFLCLDRIQMLAHLAENLLSRARNGELRIVGHYADVLLEATDTLKTMVEGVRSVAPGSAVPVPDKLHDLLARLSALEAIETGAAGDDIREDSASPAAEEIEAEEPAEAESEQLPRAELDIGQLLIETGEAEPEAVARAATQQNLGDPRRIGEILVEKEGVAPQAIVKALNAQGQAGGARAPEGSIRVNTSRLNHLVDMVGELVIAHSMIAQDPDAAADASPQLSKKVSHTGKITRELQDLTMSLRMVPLKATFDKMRRVLRDLARKSGKSIRLVTEGDDTEVDRNMVEALGDPLVHMIRNAADHGVESSEERKRRGKDEVGTLRLSASHSAGSVVIELTDDGEGLNYERILAKSIENGLVEAGRNLPEDQIAELIFQPGFSTAKIITDVSGRGVGMDVVKRGIEALHGRVQVASESGVGTTFTLTFPLTMAITDAMLVAVGSERYLLPTASIQQSFHPSAESLTTLMGHGETVLFRGTPVPIVRLHTVFGVKDAVTDPKEGLLIVVEAHGTRCALLADALLGQHQVVVKSLGDFLGHIAGVSGGAILGDGLVGLILDPAGVVQLAHSEGEREPIPLPHSVRGREGNEASCSV